MVIGSWGVAFCGLFIYYVLKKNQVFYKSAVINAIKVMILFIGFQVLLNMTNNMLVEKSEDLEIFDKWSSYRVTVQDYGIPSYDDNKEIYEKYGIIKEDIEFYLSMGI